MFYFGLFPSKNNDKVGFSLKTKLALLREGRGLRRKNEKGHSFALHMVVKKRIISPI